MTEIKVKKTKTDVVASVESNLNQSSAGTSSENHTPEELALPAIGVESTAAEALEVKQEAALDVLFPKPEIVEFVGPVLNAPTPTEDEIEIDEFVGPEPDAFVKSFEAYRPPFLEVLTEFQKILWAECRALNGGGTLGTLIAQRFKQSDMELINLRRFLIQQGHHRDGEKK